MHDHFYAEIWRTLAVLLVASLVGSVTDYWGWSLFFGTIGLLAWHLQQIFLLERWVNGGSEHQADIEIIHGVWRYLAEYSERAKKQSRKRKKRLSRLLQRFHQTLEAMPDGAVVLDDKLGVEWSNSAAKRLLGISHRDEEATKNILNVLPDEVFTVYLKSQSFEEPLDLHSPQNPAQALKITVTPFGQGQLLLTAHDVTESKRLQSARRDFIANVSHELRTPLTVISGYMEMLLFEEEDPAIKNALESSHRQAERMKSIVHDLLMLSRLEMEGDEPMAEGFPVEIGLIIPNLVGDAEQLSDDKQHVFQQTVDSKLGLLGSEKELTSAFGNLIFNAVIHTPPGTAINVYWGRDGEDARFVVADKGPGIEPKHLQRLTERFYRVDKGRSRESGGTGLGLSIVKHVVKRHEGVVEIDSTPGVGTRFICSFPASRVIEMEEPDASWAERA